MRARRRRHLARSEVERHLPNKSQFVPLQIQEFLKLATQQRISDGCEARGRHGGGRTWRVRGSRDSARGAHEPTAEELAGGAGLSAREPVSRLEAARV